MLFIGILYSSIAIIVSLLLFFDYSSLTILFFTAAACIPTIYWSIKLEEKKDLTIHDEKLLIKEHGKALTFYMFLFIGFVISFSLWYLLTPESISLKLFEIQSVTIKEINNPLTGNAFNFAATFAAIIFNNLKVMMFCLVFAFFYGFGAIFILTWNASIIGVAVGEFVRTHIGSYATVLPLALAKYLLHGIPEIIAYFMAGMAGGIISIAVIRHDFASKNFKHILTDSADLTFGAIVMLVIAALLEVFVSPLII
jgi:uncharacterized membrane protein SpoIIM required for sporulation